jgi:oxygen-independent coproporphyrinogen-3 oxidase
MISLRTMEGLDLNKIATDWGTGKIKSMERKLSLFKEHNLINYNGSRIRLTNEGILKADGIAADLFSPLSPGGGT